MSLLGERSLRDLLLWLFHVGVAGLLAELLLLEHYESLEQWIPLALLACGMGAGALVAARPSRGTLRAFRTLMAAFVAAGLLGVYYHLHGNVEFAREDDPGLRGAALVWEVLRGATPALAPGALAQLGLLGLVFAHRHPALA